MPTSTPSPIDDFSKAFPSLSDFGKRFEEAPPGTYPFERDPDATSDVSGMPGVKPPPSANGHRMETHEEEEGVVEFPDVSALPELPSVPSDKPGIAASSTRPESKPNGSRGMPLLDQNGDLKRPASSPNVVSLPDKPMEMPKTPQPPPSASPRSPGELSRGDSAEKVQSLTFPVAQPHAGPSKQSSRPQKPPPAKPAFPLTNSIAPETLRSYFLNPSVDVLLLDVRTEEEAQTGYVGVEYQDRAKINNVWLDPNVIMREGMTSARLEDALSLSTETQSKLFENRNKADIVVVYDSHSLSWPRKSDIVGQLPPLARLWEIIYELEFTKRLERTPVLLQGGYTGWVEFVKARMAANAQAYAQANGYRPRIADG